MLPPLALALSAGVSACKVDAQAFTLVAALSSTTAECCVSSVVAMPLQ
jgi:hypothetical protein